MVFRDSLLISIGYTYKTWKVLSFISTEYAGSIKSGIPYLYKYPDPFDHFYVRPVAFTLFMSKLFGSVNEVDPHNKSRQSY